MPPMCMCGEDGGNLGADGYGGSSRTLLLVDDRQKSSDGGKRLHSLSVRRRAPDRQSSDLRRPGETESLRGVAARGARAAVGGADGSAGDGAATHLVVGATGGAKHRRATGGISQEESGRVVLCV